MCEESALDTVTENPGIVWTHPNIPHAGWFHAGVELHSAGDFVCEVCGYPGATVAHVLMHQDRDGAIRVSRLCALWLTGNPEDVERFERRSLGSAGHRDRLVERHARAREHWGNPDTWLRSKKRGNYWRTTGGVRVVVFRPPGNSGIWRAVVGEEWGTIDHPTASAAMLATFERMFPLRRLLRDMEEKGLDPRLPGEGKRGHGK
jgi:hypothetical protein